MSSDDERKLDRERAARQPELFGTPAENRAITNQGISQVAGHTNEEWKTFTLDEVTYPLAKSQKDLVVDDLWSEINLAKAGKSTVVKAQVPKVTPNPSVMGWIIREAARKGWIEKTNVMKPSERKAMHKKAQWVWRSLIYEESNADNGTSP